MEVLHRLFTLEFSFFGVFFFGWYVRIAGNPWSMFHWEELWTFYVMWRRYFKNTRNCFSSLKCSQEKHRKICLSCVRWCVESDWNKIVTRWWPLNSQWTCISCINLPLGGGAVIISVNVFCGVFGFSNKVHCRNQ